MRKASLTLEGKEPTQSAVLSSAGCAETRGSVLQALVPLPCLEHLVG